MPTAGSPSQLGLCKRAASAANWGRVCVWRPRRNPFFQFVPAQSAKRGHNFTTSHFSGELMFPGNCIDFPTMLLSFFCRRLPSTLQHQHPLSQPTTSNPAHRCGRWKTTNPQPTHLHRPSLLLSPSQNHLIELRTDSKSDLSCLT